MNYRYALLIEYEGTEFFGWQIQKHAPSVQQTIEEAIYKFCGQAVTCYSAGRTDAGVHALGQVAHIDLAKFYEPYVVTRAINFHLQPHNISIVSAMRVDDKFHARFSATRRYYNYRILNRPSASALYKNKLWHIKAPLNIAAMQQAANYLLGKHDFSSFRAAACQANSPIITLDTCQITQNGNIIDINLNARSFLHHMVRNIVGTLHLIGIEKLSATDICDILNAKDRNVAGPTAPAHGLYLTKVDYNNNLDIMEWLDKE